MKWPGSSKKKARWFKLADSNVRHPLGHRVVRWLLQKVRKTCMGCSASLPMHVLHWNLGLCDSCYDSRKQHPQQRSNLSLAEGFDMGVRTCITAQLIFYMALAVMQPSLYLEVQRAEWQSGNGDAASSYAAVLTTATMVAMAAPIPFGYWAERRGERQIYFGVTLAATLAALVPHLRRRTRHRRTRERDPALAQPKGVRARRQPGCHVGDGEVARTRRREREVEGKARRRDAPREYPPAPERPA